MEGQIQLLDMMDNLNKLFIRDLEYLKKEINAYESENLLWITEKSINNSGGNLCLHMVGNLRHFIGHVLGGSDYIREREREFNDKNIALSELNRRIDLTTEMIQQELAKLNPSDLEAIYPLEVLGYEVINYEI